MFLSCSNSSIFLLYSSLSIATVTFPLSARVKMIFGFSLQNLAVVLCIEISSFSIVFCSFLLNKNR